MHLTKYSVHSTSNTTTIILLSENATPEPRFERKTSRFLGYRLQATSGVR